MGGEGLGNVPSGELTGCESRGGFRGRGGK
jgi:hypothetical protein